jgi:hypothetical protein
MALAIGISQRFSLKQFLGAVMDDQQIDKLIAKLLEAARADPATHWYEVVSGNAIAFVEATLDVTLPKILKHCYTRISNGGFGPGYQLTGLPGGHDSSWGDLLQTTFELRRHDDCEEEWVPLIDWGCAQFTIVDCTDAQIITLYNADFHCEDYTLDTLFEKWIIGEVPSLDSGTFHRLR